MYKIPHSKLGRPGLGLIIGSIVSLGHEFQFKDSAHLNLKLEYYDIMLGHGTGSVSKILFRLKLDPCSAPPHGPK